MQTRRSFFKNLSAVIAGVIISPNVVKALEETSEDVVISSEHAQVFRGYNFYTQSLSGEDDDKKLTEKFFNFLKNNPTNFKWERVNAPIFKLNDGRVYQCKSLLMRGSNYDSTLWEVFTEFCRSESNHNKLYIYELNHTHIHSSSSEPIKRIIIRYIRT